MDERIEGLHHVTCITRDVARNVAFYTTALGLRLVKRTVNFDRPRTWHLYYGDELGRPGTAMTFFGWDMPPGQVGARQATLTQFAVPPGALGFWETRLPAAGAVPVARETVFGETRAVFSDPDGLRIALVEAADTRRPWLTDEIGTDVAVRGFHGVTLSVHDAAGAERVLGEAFGYRRSAQEDAVTRWRAPGAAGVVDIHAHPAMAEGTEGSGTVHHVAFRAPNGAAQLRIRERMLAAGLRVTPQIDRSYFTAIYARVPGGVLFEVATDAPGFTVDEPAATLGTTLMLPAQHEHLRTDLRTTLPPLGA